MSLSSRQTQAEKYEFHLKEHLSSGLSIKAYCAKHNINHHTFSYYRSKSRRHLKIPSSKESSSSFVEAKILASKRPTPLSGGLNLSRQEPSQSVPIDPTWLAKFVRSVWEAQ